MLPSPSRLLIDFNSSVRPAYARLTDSWNFSPLFGDWTTANVDDAPFGGRLWSTENMHEDCNAFFFQPPDSKMNIPRLLELLVESLESKAPTRFLLVIPKQNSLPNLF